jgi:hypothetical protein
MTTSIAAPNKIALKKSASEASKVTPKTATKLLTKLPSKRPAKLPVQAQPIAVKTETPGAISKLAVKILLEKPLKAKKIKLVRDSFTIPKPEYLILDNLKLRATDLKHPVKKSELLRAGIKALAAMTDAHLLAALNAVPMLKTGRPSK